MPQDTSDLMPFWLRVSTLHSSADQLQIQIEIKWSQDWTQHVLINMTSALINANWQNIKEENRTVRLKELMVDLPIPTHQSDDKWTNPSSRTCMWSHCTTTKLRAEQLFSPQRRGQETGSWIYRMDLSTGRSTSIVFGSDAIHKSSKIESHLIKGTDRSEKSLTWKVLDRIKMELPLTWPDHHFTHAVTNQERLERPSSNLI